MAEEEVRLGGGGPWGFRLQGGAGTGLPLIVAKVRRKSKAHGRLHEGDRVVSVNGCSCDRLTYDRVMEIADGSGQELTLRVLRHESKRESRLDSKLNNAEQSVPPDAATRESVSFSTDTTTKITKETEGLRIKSATLLSDMPTAESTIDNFSSDKLQNQEAATAATAPQPFHPFQDISTKTEEIRQQRQDDSDRKEVTREVVTTVVKETSVANGRCPPDGAVPGITLDTIDLNNLISATQKKLDSLKDSMRSDGSATKAKAATFAGRSGETLKTETKQQKTDATTTEEVAMKRSDGGLSKSDATQKSSEDMFQVDTSTFDKSFEEMFKRSDAATVDKAFDEIFKSGSVEPKLDFKTDSTTKSYEIKKTEISSTTTESKFSSNASALGELKDIFPSPVPDFKKSNSAKKTPPPTLPKPKVRPLSDGFLDSLRDFRMGLNETLGLAGSDSESSSYVTESPFGTTFVTKKKKMFSSSSFYEEPNAIYPTFEEQVKMAQQIAHSLADDTNRKSKGANMFFKRVNKSSEWIHEGGDDDTGGGPESPGTARPGGGLRLLLDPRHTEDASSLRSAGRVIVEHDGFSPVLCRGLVHDLNSPKGKGAALFAKRQKKSEEWVVDEERVRSRMKILPVMPPPLYPPIGVQQEGSRSPWVAEPSFRLPRVDPDRLADTVIRAADYKRTNSAAWEPGTPVYGDLYRAKAPQGWVSTVSSAYAPAAVPAPDPLPSFGGPLQNTSLPMQNGFPKQRVFQNFNTVPRLWRGGAT